MAGKWLAGRVFERVLVPLIASVIGGGASWLWYWEMREAPGTEPTAPGTASPGTEQHDRVAVDALALLVAAQGPRAAKGRPGIEPSIMKAAP